MVTTLTLTAAIVRARKPEPCCPPDQCDYSPERVRRFLKTINDLRRECSAREAIRSVYYSNRGYEHERGGGFDSGSSAERASQVVVDLIRAIQAGKRDPVAISAFLCPLTASLTPTPATPVDESAAVRVS